LLDKKVNVVKVGKKDKNVTNETMALDTLKTMYICNKIQQAMPTENFADEK
jgi:hypothetical protein